MAAASAVVGAQSPERQAERDVWALAKGQRLAVCRLRSHAAGREIIVVVDRMEWLSVVGRDAVPLLERAAEWLDQFCSNGWVRVAWPIDSLT